MPPQANRRPSDDRCRSAGQAPADQARYRAAREAGKPIMRIRRPTDLRSRVQQWRDEFAVLVALQERYAAWLETIPPGLEDSITAQALQAMCDLDLSDLQPIDPPKGFGRD